MTVVCINDLFTTEARKVYEQYGIVTPREGIYYTIRDVIITRVGTGFLLEELINPKMWIYGEGENAMYAEPNFKISRFRNIDGTEINVEQLRHETKDTGVTT